MRVYTAGTFDLPHLGHFKLLNMCKRIAGREAEVCVVLNTDDFVESYKGSKPVLTYEERAATLEEVYPDMWVYPNNHGPKCWQSILDDIPGDPAEHEWVIVIGSDWKDKDYAAQMGVPEKQRELFESRLIYVPYTSGISTTEIKRRLKEI